jgi:hypothetical protein
MSHAEYAALSFLKFPISKKNMLECLLKESNSKERFLKKKTRKENKFKQLIET